MSETSENFDYSGYGLSRPADVEQGIREAAIDVPFVTLGQSPELPTARVIGADTLELVASADRVRVWSETEIAALRPVGPPLNER